VLDGLLTTPQMRAMKSEVLACHKAGKLETAGLVNGKKEGSEEAKYFETAIRGDVVGWFDSDEEGWPFGRQLESYLVKLGTLIAELGGTTGSTDRATPLVPDLGKVTSRSKAMVACYPGGGARYIKHVDNDGKHQLCRTRLLTALMYLNDEWTPGDGGELAIYKTGDESVLRDVVEPLANRMLLFWSDWRTPHAVLPASKPRYAVTLWLLDNTCGGMMEGTPVAPQFARLSDLVGSGGANGAGGATLGAGDAQEVEAEEVEEKGEEEAARGGEVEAVGGVESEAPQASPPEGPRERGGVRYEWRPVEALAADAVAWDLLLEVLGEAPQCPLLEISEVQVRIADGSGRPLLCLPLPAAGVEAGAPRWSKRSGMLTLRFEAPSSLPAPAPSASEALARQLADRGWGYADGFLSGPEADALQDYVFSQRAAGNLRVGRAGHEGNTASGATKNDEYTFLDDASGSAAEPLRVLAKRCNRLLAQLSRDHSVPELQGLNLTQGHPMLAVYPGDGARYGRHYDSTSSGRGDNGRVLTLLCYLNPFWREEDGGSLRLLSTLSDEQGVADVAPLHGRVAAFLCRDKFPHEVLPALWRRAAVTLWYYDGNRLSERCGKGPDIEGFAFEGG